MSVHKENNLFFGNYLNYLSTTIFLRGSAFELMSSFFGSVDNKGENLYTDPRRKYFGITSRDVTELVTTGYSSRRLR